jgi:hypothetical protein
MLLILTRLELWCVKENFEDTKGVIRSRKSKKDRQYNDKRKSTKEQTLIHKTLRRKIKTEQHEST